MAPLPISMLAALARLGDASNANRRRQCRDQARGFCNISPWTMTTPSACRPPPSLYVYSQIYSTVVELVYAKDDVRELA